MVGKIIGTGSYIPEQVWENEKLSQMVDTNDEWIRERTGIARRHIAGNREPTVYMAAEAAKAALDNAGIRAEEVDLILVATISPGEIMPCTACGVQERIGASRATCFDLSSACTGFLFALNTAQAYLGMGIYRTALVIGAERLSNLTNWKDRGTCILFGDGAGAAVLQASPEGFYVQVTHSTGEKGSVLTCTSRNQEKYEDIPAAAETYMQMDGKEVFKFAVSREPEVIRELLEQSGKKQEEIRYYLLHQANERIVKSVAKRLGESMEKFPMNISQYGNTSSASIPILMDEQNRKGAFSSGDFLVLSGFGGGLSYGASLLRW
ncbi:beta-ketoacyl-ACP synthase III [Ruminococcus sp. 5_1_39BFAA]|uniref:beta-ketoacyl-ACP synthase III n=1 Tax=Ruminococcus sp. 5_1_39BFAA TaxID=457412 RepID=UPI0035614418